MSELEQPSSEAASSLWSGSNLLNTKDCWFCGSSRFFLNRELELPPELDVLSCNESLFITPDIAPIVPGHILIVSHLHLRGLTESAAELQSSLSHAIQSLRQFYLREWKTSVIFFEHCGTRSDLTSACVNHLHIHCMPWSKAVRYNASADLKIPYSLLTNGLASIAPTNSAYLYLQDVDGADVLFESELIPSQYFRSYFFANGVGAHPKWQIACSHETSQVAYRSSALMSGRVWLR